MPFGQPIDGKNPLWSACPVVSWVSSTNPTLHCTFHLPATLSIWRLCETPSSPITVSSAARPCLRLGLNNYLSRFVLAVWLMKRAAPPVLLFASFYLLLLWYFYQNNNTWRLTTSISIFCFTHTTFWFPVRWRGLPSGVRLFWMGQSKFDWWRTSGIFAFRLPVSVSGFW